jgi:hypothetical protein
VRHPISGVRPDSRQPEFLSDGRHDRNGPICRDGQHTVGIVAARECGYRLDVGEVDDLGGVGETETRRPRVTVDGGDPQSPPARLLDRAALVAPRADEEDGLHSRRS